MNHLWLTHRIIGRLDREERNKRQRVVFLYNKKIKNKKVIYVLGNIFKPEFQFLTHSYKGKKSHILQIY